MKKFLFIYLVILLSAPASAKVCVKTAMSLDGIYNAIYPVGSIYTSTKDKNPNDLLGFGTWERFGEGRVLIGIGTSDREFVANETGGTSTHTLSVDEMPSHTHIQNPHGHTIQVAGPPGGGIVSVRDGSYATGSYGNAIHSTTAINQNTGSGTAHNNLPPYATVYMWRRVS